MTKMLTVQWMNRGKWVKRHAALEYHSRTLCGQSWMGSVLRTVAEPVDCQHCIKVLEARGEHAT